MLFPSSALLQMAQQHSAFIFIDSKYYSLPELRNYLNVRSKWLLVKSSSITTLHFTAV